MEMKKLYKSEQSGRSMVEMLGVLAIIGVLSVGGIAGYSKAMAKYKMTKTIDQISMLSANIRTAFASSSSYAGLTTENARKWGFASADMYEPGVATTLVNPFLGQVKVGAATSGVQGYENMGFFIQYLGIPLETCVTLATADWGISGFSGVASGDISEDGSAEPDGAIATDAVTGKVTFAGAAALCANAADENNTNIAIFFR